MSSRVRIYFLDRIANVENSGKHAIERLEALYNAWGGKSIRVHNADGRYFVNANPWVPDNVKPAIPLKLSKAQKALWLWKHLPEQIRRVCKFALSRDGRGTAWRYSKANISFRRKLRAKPPQAGHNVKAALRRGGIDWNQYVRPVGIGIGNEEDGPVAAPPPNNKPKQKADKPHPRIGIWS